MYHTPYWGNGKGELFSFMLTVVILRKYLFQNNFLYALKSSVDWLYFLKIINIQRSKNWLTAREIYRFMTSDICCSKCTNRFNFFLVFFFCWYNYCLLRTPYNSTRCRHCNRAGVAIVFEVRWLGSRNIWLSPS